MSANPKSDLLDGLCELLATAGVGTWSPNTAVGTSTSVPVIAQQATPPESPLSITLNLYDVQQDAALTDQIIGLNVRVRGDRRPQTARNIAHQVWLALHALGRQMLGTAPNQVIINDIFWQSEVELGPDENQRFERSINYYVRMNVPHPRLV